MIERIMRSPGQVLGAVALVAILASTALIADFAYQLQNRFVSVEADHGNELNWTASQVEVDLLLLLQLARETQNGSADIVFLRRRHAAFQSRIGHTVEGVMRRELQDQEGYEVAASKLQSVGKEVASFFEADDRILQGSLPKIIELLASVRLQANKIALVGVGTSVRHALEVQMEARKTAEQSKFVQRSVIAAEAIAVLALLYLMFRLRKAARRAKELALEFEAMLSASPYPTCLLKPNADVMHANEKAIGEFCGEGQTLDPTQKNFLDCIVNTDDHERFLKEIRNIYKDPKSSKQSNLTLKLRNANDKVFRAEIFLNKVFFKEQPFVGALMRDIENQLCAQQDLIQARDAAMEADKAKSRFLKMISHESRTPLQGLYGALEILEKSDEKRLKDQALLSGKMSVDVLARHIENILTFVSNSSDDLALVDEVFDVEELFADLKGVLKSEILNSNCKVHFSDETEKSLIKGDRSRVRQVLIGMIINALKSTDDGTINVGAREIAESDGHVEVEFFVSDTGIGIAAEDQDRVFEEFVSLSPDKEVAGTGMGLGLALSKKIVNSMGGYIKLESEVGVGSRFSFPLRFERSNLSKRVEPEVPTARAGEKILLVDDNYIVRDTISGMLTSIGYSVTTASGGKQGVTLALAEPFDLILMDISMPTIDGVTAAKMILRGEKRPSQAPIVCLTAHAAGEDEQRFLEAGMHAVLLKPVKLHNLAKITRDSIDSLNDAVSVGAAVIDEDAVRQMLLFSSPAKAAEKVDQIRTHLKSGSAELRVAIQVEDGGDAADIAHKLAGTAQLVGADRLCQTCYIIEDVGRGRHSDLSLADASADLEADVKQTCEALDRLEVA